MILIGINHKNTPLSIREKFYFDQDEIALIQKKYFQFPLVILSTCNRTEIYFEKFSLTNNKLTIEKIINIFLKFKKLSHKEIMDFFYIFEEEKAILHLFKVSTSLNSMIIGETQILGQLKRAYKYSSQQVSLPPYLNKIFQEAISLGKKVRSKTKIGEGEVCLGSITIDLIKNVFKNSQKLTLLIFGTGKIASEIFKNIENIEIKKIFFTTRNSFLPKKKFKTKEKIAIQRVNFKEKLKYVEQADIIISATSGYVLTREDYLNSLGNQLKLKLLIDLGVPRNLDPKIIQVKNTVLYSLDDLKERINKNLSKRINEINQVKKIINQQMVNLEKWRVKKSFFEIFSLIEKQLQQVNFKKKENILIQLKKFKKNLPENKIDYEEKLNQIILFFFKKNIKIKLNQ